MRIVVTGLIATYPLGGVAWDYVQFVEGFARLGCDVTYLEDTGQWVYDPAARTFSDDPGANVRHLAAVVGRVPGASWAFRGPKGILHGMSADELVRRCRGADLFLNLSGSCWFRDEYRGARVSAYYDSDPLYTQAAVAAVESGSADAATEFSVALFRKYDVYFTMAENIADPSCTIPRCGVDWKTTRQPIVLDDWPFAFDAGARAFTTVMSWRTKPALPALGGRIYGGKDVELMRFLDLPNRTSAPLEIALSGAAPTEALERAGWSLVDPAGLSSTPERYREYIAASRGEVSVAKEAYVATESGWFSCRSAAYLASGKPVVVEDTGFSKILPTGEGVFAFRTVDEAAAAIEVVNADYRRQCEAARAAAEGEFRAETVLEKLVRDAGL